MSDDQRPDDLEWRLHAMLTHRADAVDPRLSGPVLRARAGRSRRRISVPVPALVSAGLLTAIVAAVLVAVFTTGGHGQRQQPAGGATVSSTPVSSTPVSSTPIASTAVPPTQAPSTTASVSPATMSAPTPPLGEFPPATSATPSPGSCTAARGPAGCTSGSFGASVPSRPRASSSTS